MPHSTGQRTTRRPATDPRLSLYSHAIAPAAGSGALERALLAALRLRRPQVLGRLAEQAGAQAFAQALAGLSARQVVDVLSLLPAGQRAAACTRLPAPVRRHWQAACRSEPLEPQQARPQQPHVPLARRSLLPRPPGWNWPWRARAAAGAGAAARAPA